MVIRNEELDKEFKKKLQNPAKPINSTSSPAIEQYINDINSGKLIRDSLEKKKPKDEEHQDDYFCPMCKRATLKRSPFGWACGQCGFETNTPLRMSRE